MSETLERELPQRLIIAGDLNGHASVLERILKGLGLIAESGGWSGGRAVFVQIGDLVNRGPGSKRAMDLMLRLGPEARAAGGDAIWLLGNHEVLTTLRHEAYVTPDEYLEFATRAEARSFQRARSTRQHEILVASRMEERVPPIGGRILAWEEENVPGRDAFAKAMGPEGRYGKKIRALPTAVRMGPLVLVHGGIDERWAARGLEGIAGAVKKTWASRPKRYLDLDPGNVLRDADGPLWHRRYCFERGRHAKRELHTALGALDAQQMIVGHTRTDAVSNVEGGRPLALHGDKLIMTDVGLGDAGEPGSVLVIKKGKIEAWSPGGAKAHVAEVARA